MPIVSKAEFARLARVTPSAISEAIEAHLVVPAGPGRRDGIDTTLARNAAYLAYPDRQRHEGAWRRQLNAARSERSSRDAQAELEYIMQMAPGYERVAAFVDFYWKLGVFPEGWAILGLRDAKADNGFPVPLVFYSPNSEEGDLGVGARTPGFQVIDDGKGPVCARDAQGLDHPLVLRMFGRVPWLRKQVGPRAAAKSAKYRTATKPTSRVGGPSVSDRSEKQKVAPIGSRSGRGADTKQKSGMPGKGESK